MRNWFFVALALVTITSPFWYSITRNELAAFTLERELAAVRLPQGARILYTGSRVFNGGNGDACDFESFAVIQYSGFVSELRDNFVALLKNDRLNENGVRLYLGNSSKVRWGAKLIGGSTELNLVPNDNHAGRYLVSLGQYPHSWSFDFRCW